MPHSPILRTYGKVPGALREDRRGGFCNRTRTCAERAALVLAALSISLPGCGNMLGTTPYVLFTVPFSVDGESVGSALIDTGGSFEIMLRETYGLDVVGSVDVLSFDGPRTVDMTAPFTYRAGGIQAQASGAIVGAAACDCNALGIEFFRKTGVILSLDFRERTAAFAAAIAQEGVFVPFADPPEHLRGFDSAFLEVDVTSGSTTKRMRALLDTGAAASVMYRGALPGLEGSTGDRQTIDIRHDALGTVRAGVILHLNDAVPELIIGNDILGAWGNQWYFRFDPVGGYVVVVPAEPSPSNDQAAFSRSRQPPALGGGVIAAPTRRR
ncbi:MAG: hypothetical protein J5J06_03000 [Phycisphaerae bacterium]|nr:hypothetical protein [Phycisphaerae bacterium]